MNIIQKLWARVISVELKIEQKWRSALSATVDILSIKKWPIFWVQFWPPTPSPSSRSKKAGRIKLSCLSLLDKNVSLDLQNRRGKKMPSSKTQMLIGNQLFSAKQTDSEVTGVEGSSHLRRSRLWKLVSSMRRRDWNARRKISCSRWHPVFCNISNYGPRINMWRLPSRNYSPCFVFKLLK